MNLYIKKILKSSLILSLFIFVSACDEYLEISEENTISADEAFEDFTNFQGFTEELYQCIPDFTNRYWTNSWNWGEDEIQSTSRDFHFGVKIDNGDF